MFAALRSLLVLAIFFCGCLASAAIYGTDDRKDIDAVPALRKQAQAIAITIAKNFIERVDATHVRVVQVGTLAQNINICPTERFATQPVFEIGTCTGFLIDDQHLLTAGHCILPNGIVDNAKHPFCDSFTWYFDFNTASGAQTTDQVISKSKLYGCTRIIRAENINGNDNDPDHDFAIIELDRKVEGVAPLSLRKTPALQNELVFAIGHPFGLPAKFSGAAPIHNVKLSNTFAVNLDTFGGNSGSPVFDSKNQVLGILISGHPVDFAKVQGKTCEVPNRCNSTGQTCVENSPFKWLPTSNFIQRLAPVLKYLE